MTSVLFLANAGSPHVRQWSVLLHHAGILHTVATIHTGNLLLGVKVRRHFRWLRYLGRVGDLIGYALLGLQLRLTLHGRRNVLLHAHNTSGYGLAAWLSGCPYVVTTYGTEIYSAPARGGIYRRLIQAVLNNARRVTASTASMAAFLKAHFAVPAERIDAFTLGIDPIFFPDAAARTARRHELGIGDSELVWIYNRRVTPLYNTMAVVAAFAIFRAEADSGRLLLLEGNSNKNYFEAVLDAVAECPAIHVLRGFIDQEGLRGWLSAADFSISVPDSDQLSSSILESIACGCLPVLLNNPAYAPVIASPLAIVVPEATEAAMLTAFRAGEGRRDQLGKDQREARRVTILGEEFSTHEVCRRLRVMYVEAWRQLETTAEN